MVLLAQATSVPTIKPACFTSRSKLFSRPPRPKSSPAPPSTTRARPPSRGTSTPARGLPSFSNGGPACRCSTPGPSCLRARLRDCYSLRVLRIRIVLLGAACFFIFLQILSWPPSSSAASGIRPTVACAAAAAFFPQVSPSSVAQTALREDHLVYGQIARGSPSSTVAMQSSKN